MPIWQMTLDEYRASLRGKKVERGPAGFRLYTREGQIQADHRQAVEWALQGGQPVPAHVLAHYRGHQLDAWSKMFGAAKQERTP